MQRDMKKNKHLRTKSRATAFDAPVLLTEQQAGVCLR